LFIVWVRQQEEDGCQIHYINVLLDETFGVTLWARGYLLIIFSQSNPIKPDSVFFLASRFIRSRYYHIPITLLVSS
jgi:hypothetical protein